MWNRQTESRQLATQRQFRYECPQKEKISLETCLSVCVENLWVYFEPSGDLLSEGALIPTDQVVRLVCDAIQVPPSSELNFAIEFDIPKPKDDQLLGLGASPFTIVGFASRTGEFFFPKKAWTAPVFSHGFKEATRFITRLSVPIMSKKE